MSIFDIALFPIPGSVSLPFEKVPLHIFEPRYRQMIQDCVSSHRRIGVAHTQGTISESKVNPAASPEERLNSNHATYQAHPVFSAGFAKILETLPDGRILVEIAMDSRYQMLSEIQKLPYKVVNCQLFKDESEEHDSKLREDVDKLLLLAAGDNSEILEKIFQKPEWINLSLFEYSFKVYSLVSLNPDILQKVLELRSTNDRISFLKTILSPRNLN
jgi:Lon protease-like protein